MVKEYSIIQGGKVINRIICSDEFALKYAEENGVEVTDSQEAVIGATKSNGRFVKPQPEAREAKKSEVEMLKETLIAKGILTEADASIEVKK
jgi:hypothetical protein